METTTGRQQRPCPSSLQGLWKHPQRWPRALALLPDPTGVGSADRQAR